MGGMEATKVWLRCGRATLLLGRCRGHGHGKKWNRECHIGHMLRCGQWGLRGAKRRYRGQGNMRGERKGGTVG